MYNLHIAVNEPEGQPLDETTIRTGIRHVEVKRWQFKVNGQPEFIRGLNWVPADCFPGPLRRERYSNLLALARESGANLLRVWGGGLREKRAFYDLCDEMGLLVWQESPFACLFLGSYPRHRAYLALVEAECRAIIRQLRHHPCVAVWCGGNEFSRWRNQPLLTTLAGVVRREDPGRPFIPVSPGFDHGGDRHNWDVWHGHAPIRAYQNETAAFLSEFGLQALPDLDTLAAVLPNPANGWETHHADVPKLTCYTSAFGEPAGPQLKRQNAKTPMSKSVRAKKVLADFITTSQRAQAVALQTAIEHMRRRKGEAGGLCVWQFNEPWPAISWAIVDYFGRSKLAYRQLKQWYQPVLVSLKFPVGHRWFSGEVLRMEIWGINDSRESWTGCELQVKLNGKPIHRQTVDLPANSVQKINAINPRLTGPLESLSLTLHQNGQLVAQNSYDLSWHDEIEASLLRRIQRRLADWVLK